jgi:hypothetical protein
MTIFEARETAQWSTRELDRLIGRHVFIEIDGDQSDGHVVEAGVGRGAIRFIVFSDGGWVEWRPEDTVRVSVHAQAPEASPL